MSEETFKIGLKRYLFHAKIVSWRKEHKMSQIEFASYCEIPINRYQLIEQLRRYPTPQEATKIADAMDIDCVTLFPKWTVPVYMDRSNQQIVEVKVLQLDSPEIRQLAEPTEIEEELSEEELTKALNEALETLNPREKKVVELRFGLKDGVGKDLETVGKEFGVTRERVRQIEAKALRKLRHPARSACLRRYI